MRPPAPTITGNVGTIGETKPLAVTCTTTRSRSVSNNYHAITATTALINIRTLKIHKETILNATLFGSLHVYNYILLFRKQPYFI